MMEREARGRGSGRLAGMSSEVGEVWRRAVYSVCASFWAVCEGWGKWTCLLDVVRERLTVFVESGFFHVWSYGPVHRTKSMLSARVVTQCAWSLSECSGLPSHTWRYRAH